MGMVELKIGDEWAKHRYIYIYIYRYLIINTSIKENRHHPAIGRDDCELPPINFTRLYTGSNLNE